MVKLQERKGRQEVKSIFSLDEEVKLSWQGTISIQYIDYATDWTIFNFL